MLKWQEAYVSDFEEARLALEKRVKTPITFDWSRHKVKELTWKHNLFLNGLNPGEIMSKLIPLEADDIIQVAAELDQEGMPTPSIGVYKEVDVNETWNQIASRNHQVILELGNLYRIVQTVEYQTMTNLITISKVCRINPMTGEVIW